MPRVVHFDIHADDPERAVAFYSQVFSWEFSQFGGQDYWLITTGPDDTPGINGGLTRRPCPLEGQAAANAFVCTVAVDDVDASLGAVQAAGGTVALPKMAIPGVGWLAYGKDTEGNTFGMMAEDPQAA